MTAPAITGFGGEHQSESVAGALPVGRNSPQRPAFGLYAEQFSGTAFTMPRHLNRRTWFYRRLPGAQHPPFTPLDHAGLQPFGDGLLTPNRLRWNAPAIATGADFLDSLQTVAGNGSVDEGSGVAVHLYACDTPMTGRAMLSADGELLLVPQQGTLQIMTETGRMTVPPGHIALIPRGLRFRIDVTEPSRGYCLENHGAMFCLPDLGPIGANGLAAARDFATPAAETEADAETELVMKLGGRLWRTTLADTPFDVVAWHGNLLPWHYDLARFNAIGTVSFDHPDPSIFTVLTSPSGLAGTANCDFAIFPPRWMVGEDTFRPPWFHRNYMSEYMGLISGIYDAKADGFVPGGASLHNRMTAHGPDAATHSKASTAALTPEKFDGGLAFMFETMRPYRLTRWAEETPLLQPGYDDVWQGFTKGMSG